MRGILIALLSAACIPLQAQQPAPEVCEDYDQVRYSPIVGSFRETGGDGRAPFDIIIVALTTKAPNSAEDYGGARPETSPHGTAFFLLREADMTKPDPWNSSLFVFGNKARPIGLRVDFRGHANYGVRAKWINDKLISMQVWRGRIVSIDLILDIERARFIYADGATYSFGGATHPGCANAPSPR